MGLNICFTFQNLSWSNRIWDHSNYSNMQFCEFFCRFTAIYPIFNFVRFFVVYSNFSNIQFCQVLCGIQQFLQYSIWSGFFWVHSNFSNILNNVFKFSMGIQQLLQYSFLLNSLWLFCNCYKIRFDQVLYTFTAIVEKRKIVF